MHFVVMYGEENQGKMHLPTLVSCIIFTCSFNLWMFHVGFYTFAMVVSPINTSWEPTHVIIGIFEIYNITHVAMANQVKKN
jgi:hypothetical protein